MSPRLKTVLLAAVAALVATVGAQAAPERVLSSTSAEILAHATAGENGNEGGLARWRKVCPLVSGVTRGQGEQVLERVSEIAQDGGIALAGEKCTPNLYILFTPNPQQLLEGMEQKNRAFTFSCGIREPGASTSPSEVEAFIRTPRAVRVWYNTTVTTPDGATLCTDRRSRQRHTVASLVAYTAQWNLLTAFVVIDTTRLAGITQRQIADYIAMVSLVRLNPDVPVGDAQTILRLFGVSPGSAPPSLTAWDRALLKVVYDGNPQSKQQRMQLAQRMIAEVQRR